jgi:hypothetical protein
MLTIEEVISGRIVSTTLGSFGDKEMKYGYMTIETPEGDLLRFKVDAYTDYESLDQGEYVTVDAKRLGNTSIWSARRISVQRALLR